MISILFAEKKFLVGYLLYSSPDFLSPSCYGDLVGGSCKLQVAKRSKADEGLPGLIFFPPLFVLTLEKKPHHGTPPCGVGRLHPLRLLYEPYLVGVPPVSRSNGALMAPLTRG